MLPGRAPLPPMPASPFAPEYDPATFEAARAIARSFPGTEDAFSHNGTPSVKVGKKLMCRLHENGIWIPVHLSVELRDSFLESHPEYVALPDHFRNYPYLALRADCRDGSFMRVLLESSWRALAGKKLTAAWEAQE